MTLQCFVRHSCRNLIVQAQQLAKLRRCYLQTLGVMQRRRTSALATLLVRAHLYSRV